MNTGVNSAKARDIVPHANTSGIKLIYISTIFLNPFTNIVLSVGAFSALVIAFSKPCFTNPPSSDTCSS